MVVDVIFNIRNNKQGTSQEGKKYFCNNPDCKKRKLVVGSIMTAAIILLASLPSVISAQTVRTFKVGGEECDKYSDLFINILQKEYKFRKIAYHLGSGEFFFNLLVTLIIIFAILRGYGLGPS